MRGRNIISLTIALILTGNAYSQWLLEKPLTTDDLNSVAILDSITGWIVGDNGIMLRKEAVGWTTCEKITNEDLFSVYLIDSENGWAVGDNGTILHYDGIRWRNYECPTKEKLFSVSFSDASNGLAVGTHGTIIACDGLKWTILNKGLRGNLFSVSSTEGVSFIVGGLECLNIPIMKLNKASNFELSKIYDPDFVELKSIYISNQSNVWAVGNRGAAFHFNGIHWEKFPLPERLPSLNSVYFVTDENGIIVGNSGIALIYNDSKWIRENTPVEVKLNGASVYDNMYYAVGNKGTILSYQLNNTQDNTIIRDNIRVDISSYPNPSADLVNILIPDKSGLITGLLTVSNSNGQVIMSKMIYSDISESPVQINTSLLENGLYIVQIISSGWSASGKFIIKH